MRRETGRIALALEQAGIDRVGVERVAETVFDRFPKSPEKRRILLSATLGKRFGSADEALRFAEKFEPLRERDLAVRPLGKAECIGILGKIRRAAEKHPENRWWLVEGNSLDFRAYHNYAGETYVAKFSWDGSGERVISIASFAEGKVEEHASGNINVFGSASNNPILSNSAYIKGTDKNQSLTIKAPVKSISRLIREFSIAPREEYKGRFLFRIFMDEALRLARAKGLKKITVMPTSGGFERYLLEKFGFKQDERTPYLVLEL